MTIRWDIVRILVVPLSHIAKTSKYESEEWISSGYISISDVDTKDEDDVDVSMMDILPTPPIEFAM